MARTYFDEQPSVFQSVADNFSLTHQQSRGSNWSDLFFCLSVKVLADEPYDIWTQHLVEVLTLTLSRMSSNAKVIGQRSRPLG